ALARRLLARGLLARGLLAARCAARARLAPLLGGGSRRAGTGTAGGGSACGGSSARERAGDGDGLLLGLLGARRGGLLDLAALVAHLDPAGVARRREA